MSLIFQIDLKENSICKIIKLLELKNIEIPVRKRKERKEKRIQNKSFFKKLFTEIKI